jgi:hypothetical protein
MLRKLKNLTIILLLSFLAGCTKYDYEKDTITYNLDIDKTFKENIIFTLPANVEDQIKEEEDYTSTSLEYSLLKENFEPIFNNHDVYYNKKINKSLDKVEVSLDYEYLEKEFDYSHFAMQCFENYNFITDENYFEVSLSGKFYCLNDKNIEINITSIYPVSDTNGENIDNKYVWYINKSNFNNVNIHYKISRDYDDMSKTSQNTNKSNSSIFGYVKYLVGIIIIIILLIVLYKFYQKKKKDFDV